MYRMGILSPSSHQSYEKFYLLVKGASLQLSPILGGEQSPPVSAKLRFTPHVRRLLNGPSPPPPYTSAASPRSAPDFQALRI